MVNVVFSLLSDFLLFYGIMNAKMVLCNVTKWIKDDIVHVDISRCNLTVNDAKTTPSPSPTTEYDAAGSVKFTAAVVIVYGIAAMGVLALGFFSRRKRRKEIVEKETSKFMKNYDDVKFTFDKQTRVGAVTSLLQSIHSAPSDFQLDTHDRKASLFNNLAFLALPLTNIREDDETATSDDEHYGALSDKEVIFTVEDDGGTSTIGSILSDEMNTDSHTALSIDDLSSLKGDFERYMYSDDNKQKERIIFDFTNTDSYDNEMTNNETVKLISETKKPSPSQSKLSRLDSETDSEETDRLISQELKLKNEAAQRKTMAITDSLLSESEIDKLIKDLETEIADKRNLTKASSHSDSIPHDDYDHLTLDLDDDVFVDEKNDDKYHDIDICSYPSRDHSPDWVDLSKEKFFTV